jgi:hypothetical protein
MKYSEAEVILGHSILEIQIEIEKHRDKEAAAARKMIKHCREADKLEMLLVAMGVANAS